MRSLTPRLAVRFSLLLLSLLLSLAPVARTQPPGFRIETVTKGSLDLACAMAFAPDGRLFVVERATGNIRVVENGVLGSVWANVPALQSPASEAGLLGIAIDPDFLRNGHVYVQYTRPDYANVLARLTEAGGRGTNLTTIGPAIPGGGRHSGGPIAIGLDGRLYLASGDAAVAMTAQSLGSLNGKILRFNLPDGSVPRDNPRAGIVGAQGHVWSHGHRNPFGLTIHPESGVPYSTENGGFRSDEVNRIVRGGNYGWPMYEGKEPTPDPATEDPLWTFWPEPALTGCCFYSGSLYPSAFRLRLFVTDFKQSRVNYLELDPSGTTVLRETLFHTYPAPGHSFGVVMGPDGNLYTLHHEQDLPGGDTVSRFVHDGAPFPSANAMAVSGPALGGSVTFGFVARNGDRVIPFVAFQRHASATPTPFGDLWVPPDYVLPMLTVVGDGRAYLGVPIGLDANLAGKSVYVQAAVVSGSSVRLTNDASVTLR